jgi:hypothetical protein
LEVKELLEAKFLTRLTPEEAHEKLSKIKGWKVVQDPETFQVMIYFDQPQGGKAQVSVGCVLVWCNDVDGLNLIRKMLNESLQEGERPKPLGKPEYVNGFEGKKPAYYETPEEVIERLTSDPNAVYILNLDRELNAYPEGNVEKAWVLGLHLASVARLWGPHTLDALRKAAKAKTFMESLKILLMATAPELDNQVSYWHWLLMEHKDVAPQAWRFACNIIADLLNRNVEPGVSEAMPPKAQT